MIPRVSCEEKKKREDWDDRMSKVLSIELGYSLTRVCEVDYKTKKPKVYANFEFRTPANALEDGFVKLPEELGNALRHAIDQHGVKTKQVVYSISSAKIASRDTTLPYVKENKLDELVHASANDVFPVDISNCKVTHQILETQEDGEGNKKYHVALYAAPNDLLESYYTMSSIAGLQIVALDYSSNSFAAATKGVFVNGTYLAIKVDDRSSLVSVIRDGVVALQRTVPYGGDSAIDTIIELEEQESGDRVTYEKALGLLQMRSCIRSNIDASVEDEEDGGDERIKQFRMSVAESFGMFNSSIVRVIDYYNSRNSDAPIESVYITGYAESFLGLRKLMSNELGLKVEKLSDRSSEIFSGLAEGGAYINCIGAAIEPMDFIPDVHSDRKKGRVRKLGHTGAKGKPIAGEAVEKDWTLPAVLFCVLCLAAAAAIAALTLLPYQAEEKKNKQLTQRQTELAPVQDIYWKKIYSDKYVEQTKNMYYTTRNQNDNLLNFMTELENTLPNTVNVVSFSSTDEEMTINLMVDSKEAAAKTIQDIRKFDTVAYVTVAGITEEINDMGGSVVTFTLEITYEPVNLENETFEVNDRATLKPLTDSTEENSAPADDSTPLETEETQEEVQQEEVQEESEVTE